MCGICGVWGSADQEAVRLMVKALHHRGPDDTGVYHDQQVGLGMTRLAILDTSRAGHQPMLSPDGQIAIVYNGELYNFREERNELEKRGYSFKSASDTEVVLRLYEHYGDDFLLRMRGMFALAIYDRRKGPGKERLLLARDQLGIKPLLYARVNNRFVFASEIKALLASGLVAREVDPVALRLLLTYGSIYQPRTILRDVCMLPPGHRLVIENGFAEKLECYWSLDLDRHSDLRRQTYEAQVERVANAVEESVRLQMISDVPLGAFLSGGIDSSLIVAMMARRVSSGRVKTFSVGFETEGREIDETGDAERTARFLGTDHTRVVVRGKEVRDSIRAIASGLDQPSVDGVNSYFVSRAARQQVTVALSGTGADELFAGYPWFGQMLLDKTVRDAAPWKALAKSLIGAAARRPMLDTLVPTKGGPWLGRLRDGGGFLSRYYNTNPICQAFLTANLLSPDLRSEAQAGRSTDFDLEPFDELAHGSVLERVTGVCLRGYTTNQLLRDIDAASMAHSLEARVPFLDPAVTDIALSLPDSAKIGSPPTGPISSSSSYRESGTKLILLDVAKHMLPPGFDNKPKRGFSMPFSQWLKGPLRDVLLDSLSEERIKSRGLLNGRDVVNLRDRFLSGGLEWPQPWVCMMLELWAQEVLDCSSTERMSLAEGAGAASASSYQTQNVN